VNYVMVLSMGFLRIQCDLYIGVINGFLRIQCELCNGVINGIFEDSM
jgi:hypothetical protein